MALRALDSLKAASVGLSLLIAEGCKTTSPTEKQLPIEETESVRKESDNVRRTIYENCALECGIMGGGDPEYMINACLSRCVHDTREAMKGKY